MLKSRQFALRAVGGCAVLLALGPGLMPALAAGPAWSMVASPSAMAPHGALFGVSCASTSVCAAVGSYVDKFGKQVPLAEVANSGSWSLETAPNPAASIMSNLADVSCPAVTACVAVGETSGQPNANVNSTLAEAWNGTTWALLSTPNPSGTVSNILASVSCTSAVACVAVGFSYTSAGPLAPLAEIWNGTAWIIASVPLPAGATAGQLRGVSCVAAGACEAVGTYTPLTGNGMALAESWDGAAWSIQSTPNPTGGTYSTLSGVSCTSTTACTAVGLYATTGPETELAVGWDGTTWSLQATPIPGGSFQSALNGVSCVSSTNCTAVGFASFTNNDRSLVVLWNGTTWTIQPSPNPGGTGIVLQLAGVSCPAAGACTAVGWYDPHGRNGPPSTSTDLTRAEAGNGTSWAIKSAVNPRGLTYSALAGVSCASTSACAAVGRYVTGGGIYQTLGEMWNGAKWSRVPTPNPTGATMGSSLTGVSCTAPTACTAVGFFQSSAGVATLAERWTGSAWTIESTPNPAGSNGAALVGVSCSAATSCVAVGNAGGPNGPFSENWDGTVWTVNPMPVPAGAINSALYGVSCTSGAACTAVGAFGLGVNPEATLVERWDGTAWTIQPSPNPAASSYSTLSSVSCTASSACTAVGNASIPGASTLAETWDGTTWTIHATPSTTVGYFLAVACTSGGACTAVGNQSVNGLFGGTLAEAWNGTTWTVQKTPSAKGALSSLTSVSCTSSTWCFAAGSVTYVPYTALTLTELYS